MSGHGQIERVWNHVKLRLPKNRSLDFRKANELKIT
jgi:hypothetical protein